MAIEDAENPGGQRRVTASEFKAMKPYEQGFVCYMQGQWNPDVPNCCIYRSNTKAAKDWQRGEQQAYLNVQDMDDE